MFFFIMKKDQFKIITFSMQELTFQTNFNLRTVVLLTLDDASFYTGVI